MTVVLKNTEEKWLLKTYGTEYQNFLLKGTWPELLCIWDCLFCYNQIASETIGLRLKKIVAITTYAPADRFLRIELSRVFEATIYGFSILNLLN